MRGIHVAGALLIVVNINPATCKLNRTPHRIESRGLSRLRFFVIEVCLVSADNAERMRKITEEAIQSNMDPSCVSIPPWNSPSLLI